ncbi:hypothetical protein [Flagellimonas sp.]|uniref:hypothetical protein n=1 Tax=Flagellimonas sp. TaxID=2058762 RepID=UPI003BA85EDC
MNNKTYFLALLILILSWSCGKDDEPPPPQNNEPSIAAQTFPVPVSVVDVQFPFGIMENPADGIKLTTTTQLISSKMKKPIVFTGLS